MITLLQICRWLYRTLNSDVRPWQIGVAVLLGALAGLLPLGLGTLVVFLAILLINCHFGTAFFAFGIFRLMAWPLQLVLIRPLGAAFTDHLPQAGKDFLVWAAKTPVLSLFRLDYFDVAGGFALWLLLALPLLIFTTLFFRRYQEMLTQKLAQSRVMKVLSQIWLFKALRYVFVG